MYYEGLREGLRAATKVVLDIYVRDETQEIIFEINRYGKTLWRMAVARIAMIKRDDQLGYQHEAYKEGDNIVTSILDEIDWNTFYV